MSPPHRSANRVMLLTPAGTAAIAVVRITGAGVGAFLEKHFSGRPRPGRAVHGRLSDATDVIDDPVVVLGADGDFADINLHGGAWVVQATLELAQRAGFERVDSTALPLDPTGLDADSALEEEMLQHLPLATTEQALRMLLAQPQAWRRWGGEGRDRILADRSLYWMLHRPRVAIVGAPNVGKSTLANQLFAQERSITADLPGTTRDWVGEIANIDGLAVMLLDTPGQRVTVDAIEAKAIERSGSQIDSADLVILVLDAARPLEPEQSSLLARFPDAIRVINKTDRAGAWDMSLVPAIHTVATTGGGVDAVRRAIHSHFGCDDLDLQRPRWWTERQRRILLDASHENALPQLFAGGSRT